MYFIYTYIYFMYIYTQIKKKKDSVAHVHPSLTQESLQPQPPKQLVLQHSFCHISLICVLHSNGHSLYHVLKGVAFLMQERIWHMHGPKLLIGGSLTSVRYSELAIFCFWLFNFKYFTA